jgi:hypothetical protein
MGVLFAINAGTWADLNSLAILTTDGPNGQEQIELTFLGKYARAHDCYANHFISRVGSVRFQTSN